MASKTISIILVLHFFSILHVKAWSRVPALFIFGASFLDPGNDNDLNSTISKANYPPYGSTFPGGVATGRFTDGFLVPDYLSSYLKLPLIPPFRSSNPNFMHGASFAQAGCGIYNTTGAIYALYPNPDYPAPLSAQVDNFVKVKQILTAQNGSKSASKLISNAIFLMGIGDNDITTNYFGTTNEKIYTISEYTDLLVSIYASQIKILYKEGARKYVIISVRPLGCAPGILASRNIHKPGQCVDNVNEALQLFNTKLQTVLHTLRLTLQGSNILYADAYNLMYGIIQRPHAYGFEVANVGCCNFIGANTNSKNLSCPRNANTCPTPMSYVFWDAIHTTSHVYKILASHFWRGSKKYIYPTNIRTLAREHLG